MYPQKLQLFQIPSKFTNIQFSGKSRRYIITNPTHVLRIGIPISSSLCHRVYHIIWGVFIITCQRNKIYPQRKAPTYGLRYAKRSLMSWVVVIPKEGWTGNPSILLLVWNRLVKIKKLKNFKKKKIVGVIPKEGCMGWYGNDSGHDGPFRAMRPIFQ